VGFRKWGWTKVDHLLKSIGLVLKTLNPIRRIRELVGELRRTQEERDETRRRSEQLAKEEPAAAGGD
jgi:hypothetical protein